MKIGDFKDYLKSVGDSGSDFSVPLTIIMSQEYADSQNYIDGQRITAIVKIENKD
jgi:hypothetical protein